MSDEVEVTVHKTERYAVMCSEHGHVGQAYFDNEILALVIADKHRETRHSIESPPYDPAIVHDHVIGPIVRKTEDNLRMFFDGKSMEYDNARQIVEEGLWEAFDSGAGLKEMIHDD